MDFVNQGSTYILGLTFRDEGNNLVTPSSARYRVDVEGGNAVTGNNSTAWVSFTPTGNTYDLVITANQNALANNTVDREERIVTVDFTYSPDGYKQPTEYRYMLVRLKKLLSSP